ncbi:MAG: ribosome biogenesis GTPase Der [Candidatus Babeliales bacterium]
MRKLPKVIIVGRTNVGKSTLFNRLSENVKSLTLDYEGVTRDFMSDVVCWQDVCFNLIDSGGISLKKSEDFFTEHVRQIALNLLDKADLILFVCDGTVGITAQDQELAKFLHKLDKPVFLVVNKIDVHRAQEQQYEFQKLGFKELFPISAQHSIGIGELLETIVQKLPKKMPIEKEEELKASVVLLGKPNVGKSSLMNILLEQERVLVTEQAGTTREAITEPIRFYQETIMLTDTPGIRRKRSVEEPLEKLMVRTAFRAIDRAHIVLLLIDGSEGILSDQELKLAFYTLEQGKALIMLVNKVDLIDEETQRLLDDQFSMYPHLFKKIPRLYISCKSKKNIGKILPLINEVWQRYNQTLDESELSLLFKEALKRTPLYHKKELLILYSVRQTAVRPTTILLKVNQPQWFGESQLAFFDNKLRAKYNLMGVPVRYEVRKRRQ